MAAGPASYGMTDTMGRMHSDAPVSYTHLDVYKRQIQYNVLYLFQRICRNITVEYGSSRLDDSHIPVSYTHLDVYKRQ